MECEGNAYGGNEGHEISHEAPQEEVEIAHVQKYLRVEMVGLCAHDSYVGA